MTVSKSFELEVCWETSQICIVTLCSCSVRQLGSVCEGSSENVSVIETDCICVSKSM